jgi:hypothetical protein
MCVCVSRSETDESIDVDIRQKETPIDYQDVAAVPDPVPVPAQPEYEAEIPVVAEPVYGSRITQRLPEGTHSGFIKSIAV